MTVTAMPKNPATEATAAEDPAEAKKGGKKKILMILVLVLVLGGGGYWMFRPKPPAPPKPGEVVTLEAIQINLAGNHYLRIGIALQLTAKAKEADGSKALDATIDEFSGRDHGRGDGPEEAPRAEEGARAPARGAVRGRGHGGVLHGVRHTMS